MHLKRSDPQKDWNFLFKWPSDDLHATTCDFIFAACGIFEFCSAEALVHKVSYMKRLDVRHGAEICSMSQGPPSYGSGTLRTWCFWGPGPRSAR